MALFFNTSLIFIQKNAIIREKTLYKGQFSLFLRLFFVPLHRKTTHFDFSQ